MHFFQLVLLLFMSTICQTPYAEHWLANRFAQNCSGCHSPARLNLKPPDRRCTLSCQGCHVNPNGGGMRNSYGVWNQERWLRSFYFDWYLPNKRIPAPYKKQSYFHSNQNVEEESSDADSSSQNEENSEENSTDIGSLFHSKKKTKVSERRKKIPALNVIAAQDYKESSYDKSDGQEKIIARTKQEFLERITQDDPYRRERRNPVLAGGELRYLMVLPTGQPNRDPVAWLMSADLGIRYRPIPEHLTMVVEGRFMTPPSKKKVEDTFTSDARVRSAYLLIDDLPYNTYIMGGIYRPMFGLYNPDHESLSNYMTGLRQRSTFKAIGIGAAPNVPFANINLIMPMDATNYDQSSGFVANLGFRFVRFGASIVFSYWDTISRIGDQKRKMFAITGGGVYKNFIANLELAFVTLDVPSVRMDSGSVYTLQGKYRFWRENYFEIQYAKSNVTPTLQEGSGSEFLFGLRSFLLSNTDLSLSYVSRVTKTSNAESERKEFQIQAHHFF